MSLFDLIGTGIVRLFYPKRGLQEAQVEMEEGETRDELEHALPYGFAHLPRKGSEACVVFPNGDRSYGLVLSVYDREHRLKLNHEGDVAIYDDQGQVIHLTRSGIEITSSNPVTINAPETHINGALNVSGDANIGGKSFLNHTHGGVESGGASTHKPN